MVIKAFELKSGDVFIFDGKEQVAIENYSNGNCLWVTNKRSFIYPKDNKVYGYTNACIIELEKDNDVCVIGSLLTKNKNTSSQIIYNEKIKYKE